MKDDYFRNLLGINVIDVKDGYSKMSLKVKKEHTNIAGFTHGGVIFSLADCAFAEAVNFGEKKAVAIQVSINYLRPTSEGDLLTAEATTISDTRTLALCSVIVRKEMKDVAIFSGLAYKISNS
ncbi:MAG: PaaI family thioesterase [Candidatus Bathyarchaeota archaeon]